MPLSSFSSCTKTAKGFLHCSWSLVSEYIAQPL
uniref:Uncharacterized protein n=1 Tax=Rhizophora mucronata TaxID=61149 RepID=A0A2P2R4C0_RHIMU